MANLVNLSALGTVAGRASAVFSPLGHMPGKFTFRLFGTQVMIRTLHDAGNRTVQAVVKAIDREIEKILRKAKRYTPVDTGRLQESGRILYPPRNSKINFKWDIVFGGKRVRGREIDYAAAVHEWTHIKHKVGRAKYLHDAIQESLPNLLSNVARSVKTPRLRVVRG